MKWTKLTEAELLEPCEADTEKLFEEIKADEEKAKDRDLKAVKELIKDAYGHLHACICCLGTLSGILEDLENDR